MEHDATLRDLNPAESALVDALLKINPGLDEDEARRKVAEIGDFIENTPELGMLLLKLTADDRVSLKPKVQLGLLTLNTVTWGPARFWSRLLSTPASWFVGPVTFFNEFVAAAYGIFRMAQVLEETDPDVLAECWQGDEESFDLVTEKIYGFNTWARDKKLDKAFKVLSWIP